MTEEADEGYGSDPEEWCYEIELGAVNLGLFTEEIKTYLFEQASDSFPFCVIWVSHPLKPKRQKGSYKVSANLCRSGYVACIIREFTIDVLNNENQCEDLRHVRRPKNTRVASSHTSPSMIA